MFGRCELSHWNPNCCVDHGYGHFRRNLGKPIRPAQAGFSWQRVLRAARWWGLLAAVVFGSSLSQADVVTDGTVGPRQSLSGPDMRIGAELGTTRGSNLFHSFQIFNIGSGQTATFTGPDRITNVISRVTGGKASSIDGRLRSEVGHADVFFINPAGVVFGRNAEVDVPAAFHVSTADELRFADGAVYSARDPTRSSLSMAKPESFGFLSPQPASLTVNGSQLSFKPGQTATLTGGDVTIAGTSAERRASLASSGGEIRIEAVGAAGGKVPVAAPSESPRGGRLSVKHGYIDVSGGFGRETVDLQAAQIDMIESIIAADHSGDTDSPGRISLTAQQIQVTNSDVHARVYGAGGGNEIVVDASELLIDAATAADGRSRLTTRVMPGASGTAGDIRVDVDRVSLTNGGQLSSLVEDGGEGQGGTVLLRAKERITIDGSNALDYYSGIVTTAFSPSAAAGGAVVIDSPEATLSITGGGFIQSGTVDKGHAGDIRIRVSDLDLAGGSTIDSRTMGSGVGGSMEILAKDDITVADSEVLAATLGSGNAGSITISSPAIELRDSQLSVSTYGSGQAGEIRLLAPDRVTLTEQSTIDAFSGIPETGRRLGDAGRIRIETGLLSMLDSSINVLSGNLARAGSIEVVAKRIHVDNTIAEDGTFEGKTPFDASNNAAASQVVGGDLNVTDDGLSGRVSLDASEIVLDHDSDIAISTDAGNGGSVTVRADTLRLLNGSDILAATTGPGRGGDVDVHVSGTFLIEGGQPVGTTTLSGGITTSPLILDLADRPLETGPAGTITITADRLTVGRDAQIQSISFSNAPAGPISLDVGDLEVSDGGEITASAAQAGAGAAINIRANRRIKVHDTDPNFPLQGSQISSDASGSGEGGDGGSIRIVAPVVQLEHGGEITSTGDSGAGGVINLSVSDLVLRSGAQISSSTSGAGRAGAIDIDASSVLMNGRDRGFSTGTGIFSEVTSGVRLVSIDPLVFESIPGTGNAGTVNLNVRNGIELLGGAEISTSTKSAGNAGEIAISARTLLVAGGGTTITSRAAERATGQVGSIDVTAGTVTVRDGGAVTIDADQTVDASQLAQLQANSIGLTTGELFMEGGSLSARSTGNVPASAIQVRAQDIRLLNGSAITTDSEQADAGPIQISGGTLWLTDSLITTSANGSAGDGGNITITPEFLILEGGFIQANTAASGARGGDISINTRALIASQEQLDVGGAARQTFTSGIGRNVIQAAAPGGEQGTISITSPDLDIAATLAPLSVPLGNPEELIIDLCRAVRGALASSLIEHEAGGIAPSPGAPATVSFAGERLDRILGLDEAAPKPPRGPGDQE
jgi:filamentous hemagglutinin family protein